jgi:hypothetical protein
MKWIEVIKLPNGCVKGILYHHKNGESEDKLYAPYKTIYILDSSGNLISKETKKNNHKIIVK